MHPFPPYSKRWLHVAVLALAAACSKASSSEEPKPDAGDPSDGGQQPEAGPGPAPDGAAPGEALAESFVFVGCNRLDKADVHAENPSSANVAQLKRTFADVTALPDRPRFFFFTGDLVLGLTSGSTQLSSQLDAWSALHRADPVAARVPLVPLPGNHELLYKDKALGVELSNDTANATWLKWLSDSAYDGRAGNGPTSAPPNPDALQDDQSKISYSFDDGATHYVVLATDTWTTTPDPATGSTQIGWIPLRWLEADLARAETNATIRRVFVFGHKPIAAPNGNTTAADAINPLQVSDLAALLDRSSKVKGYFSAHAHEWDARRLPGARGVYQIVAGNGGSPLESKWAKGAPYFGFTEVRAYDTGRIGVVSWARPIPTPYDASATEPAKPREELTIAPGR